MIHLDKSQINACIELVIFDCDGVLVDSEVLSEKKLLTMLRELGVEVSNNYFNIHFLGHSYEHMVKKILEDFSVKLPREFRQNYQQSLMQTFTDELKTTENLKSMLGQLNLPFCVATSSSPERVKHAFNVTGLTRYFTGRVFTSSEVKKGKPAPDLFLHAAATMGVESKNCLVIEDSQAGIQAGKAAKMHVIQYTGASHLKKPKAHNDNVLTDVVTIGNWEQLFDVVPSLN